MQLKAYLDKEGLNIILKFGFNLRKDFIIAKGCGDILLVTNLEEHFDTVDEGRYFLEYWQKWAPSITIEFTEIVLKSKTLFLRVNSPSLDKFALEMSKRIPGSEPVQPVIYLGYFINNPILDVEPPKGTFSLEGFDIDEN